MKHKTNLIYPICILFFFLFSIEAIAQNSYKVEGFVKYHDKTKPTGLIVNLFKTDSDFFKQTIADSLGYFKFNLSRGNYMLVFDTLKVEKNFIKINLSQDILLDTIYVNSYQKVVAIEEISVTAKEKLIERKLDRIVFNADKALISQGGDALDALRITPHIKVQDNTISMVGKSKMALMVDDRLVNLSGEDLVIYLRSIRSEEVKSIEVITNPPAKYDAEGNSGIINIRLKKNSGNFWRANLGGAFEQATYSTASGNSRFDYQKNKLSLSTAISYVNGSIKRDEKDEIYYEDRTWITDFDKRPFTNSLAAKVTGEFRASERFRIGAQYYLTSNSPSTREDDLGTIRDASSQRLDSTIITGAFNDKFNQLHNVNLYSRFDIDTNGRYMTLDLLYFNYLNNNDRTFATNTFRSDNNDFPTTSISLLNTGRQTIDNFAAVFDVVYPTPWLDINYGAKISSIKTINRLDNYDMQSATPILIDLQSNIFEFKENTQAIYISVEKKFNKEWSAKSGLRAENTQTIGYSQTIDQQNRNNYLQLFPTVYLMFEPNSNHSYSIDYGRRIMRPNYSSLNPFRFYSSAFSYNEGNPFLQPQISNILNLQYTYKGNLNTSISYLKETSGIGEVPFVNEDTNLQYFTYLNYFTYNSYSLSQSYSFNKISWLSSYFSADLYYMKSLFSDNIPIKDTDGLGFYLSSSNTLVFNKKNKMRGQINFWYQAAENDLIYRRNARYNLDVAFAMAITKSKNLNVNVTLRDLLRTNKSVQTVFNGNIRQRYSSYSDNQSVRISLSYSFGNSKIREGRRSFGNQQEKDRTDTN